MVEGTQKLIKRISEQVKVNPGYFRSVLSSLRYFPLTNAVEYFRAVHRHGLPVKIIWGTADDVVPYSNLSFVNALIPNAEVHTLKNIGHEIPLECPEELANAIISFLPSSSRNSK